MHWMSVVAGVLAVFPAAVLCVRAGEPAAPAKPAPPPRPKVAVTAPAYCAEVKGDTEIKINAAHADQGDGEVPAAGRGLRGRCRPSAR